MAGLWLAVVRFAIAMFAIGATLSRPVMAVEANSVTLPITTSSPNGLIRFELSLDLSGTAPVQPRARILYRDGDFIKVRPLGVDLADGTKLGADCVIDDSQRTSINAEYRQYPGKRSRVVDHCNQTVITFREHRPERRWQLIVRAYDDGIALRYRFPKQDGWSSLEIADERTGFIIPDGIAYALPLNSFTTSYERRYEHKAIAEIPTNWLLGLPMLVEIPGSGWAAVTEANLTDYAGMYLARSPENNTTMISRLSPLPKEPKVAVRASLPHDSPWRVILIADRPEKLIESDLLLNLNEPSAIGDTSWIKTGKTTFPWWNGYYEKNVPFKMGLNTATMKCYIDFCAEAHIPYHSLDGSGGTNGQAWYGGTIVPYQGNDITKGIEGLDLQEVLRYAKSKGVQIRVWMHWQAAKARMAEAFPVYRRFSIEGVMLDFMDRDDQEMVNFQREVLKLAAENHLTVTFHGVAKPTGLERTFPNLLASEGVMNLEYDKWDKTGIPPEHDLTVPFTRMLAGPMDFHQGCFRTVSPADFAPRYEAPLIMGTPCRTLATYVVFQNHLSMVADYPSAYRGHPALPVLAEIPTTWDDTKAITGEVGKLIVIARRNGDTWWIGAMNGREAREIDIPLDFVGGPVRADIWRDEPAANPLLAHETKELAVGDSVHIKLAPVGGLLVRLTKSNRPVGQP